VTPKYTTTSKPAPLKSGFFNKQSAKPWPKTSQQSKVSLWHTQGNCTPCFLSLSCSTKFAPQGCDDAATPHIKAKQGPSVPDMFMIPPNEQEKQYAAMRKKLTGA